MPPTHSFERLPLQWEVAPHTDPGEQPARWISAIVPGAVQLDWARAEGWPPYWQAENFRAYDGLEDLYWTYRTILSSHPLSPDARLFFICGGVDYQCEIAINGVVIHEHEGMQRRVEIDLTEHLRGGDALTLKVFPAPKSQRERADRSQANHSCKPAVSYEWDFHPRLIPLGIWEETFLEVRPACHFLTAEIDYTLAEDFSRADLHARMEISAPEAGATFRWTLLCPKGAVAAELETPVQRGSLERTFSVAQPTLWWPHDQGTPALYTARLQLCDAEGRVLQTKETRIGFRRVRLVMAPDQWKTPKAFPKSRSTPPMTLEINGRALFAKGANWVSPEIFPGLLCRETYAEQLACVRSAHMNLLRMWGGAPAQKEAFYTLCDELGVMVWQEFPLGCNVYPDTPDYLRVLDQESRALIQRLKPHPSVVLWCGGNELFNFWSGMTDQSLPLRLLASNCYQLDPARPFLPTSPVDGVGHGHYVFRDPVSGEEAWTLFQQSRNTAYCEFGVPGPASLEVLREIIPAAELFPPRSGGSWKAHHATGAWLSTSHLYLDVIEHYFGPAKSLEEIVERGQLLQGEGLKGLFEEARRQKPSASMALCWCLNEPWPSAANNSLLSWPSRPKPALAAVGQACRPVLASARIRQYQWSEGEIFDPELFWLNDSPLAQDPGALEVRIETADKCWSLLTWNAGPLAANTNQCGPQVRWILPNLGAERFSLVLSTPGLPEAESRYLLLFKPKVRNQATAAHVMNQAPE